LHARANQSMSAPCIARARVHTHTHIPLLCDASILGSRLLEASILLATPTTRNTCESLARMRSSAMDLHSHRNQTKRCTTSVSIQRKKTKFVRLVPKHTFVNVPPSLRAKDQKDQANKDEPSSNQRDCSTDGQAHAHSEGMTKKGGKPAPPDAHDHVTCYVINTRQRLGGQVRCDKWVAVWRRSLRTGEEQRAGGSVAGASPAQNRVRAAGVGWGDGRWHYACAFIHANPLRSGFASIRHRDDPTPRHTSRSR